MKFNTKIDNYQLNLKKLNQIVDFTGLVLIDLQLEMDKFFEEKVHPMLERKAKAIIRAGGIEEGLNVWAVWNNKNTDGTFRISDWQIEFPAQRQTNFSWHLKLPIHPTSYKRYRKVRKKFKKTQRALIDTGSMLNSFDKQITFVNNAGRVGLYYVFFNQQDYFTHHEFGTGNRPKRPVLAPIYNHFINSTMPKRILNHARKVIRQSIVKKNFRKIVK